MSKTNTALLAKFLLTFLAALLTFGFLDYNTWWSVFMIALIGTIINYLFGDLVVLPRVGNITASIGDGIMASLVAYIITILWPGLTLTLTSLTVYAILVMIAEFFFHIYLENFERVAP